MTYLFMKRAPAARSVRRVARGVAATGRRVAIFLLTLPFYIYRWGISPLTPPSCRFSPTCSSYAIEALKTHGPIKGGWLTLRRVSRCHPFKWLGAGEGYDPVPPADAPRRPSSKGE